jgi:hypothetical protein
MGYVGFWECSYLTQYVHQLVSEIQHLQKTVNLGFQIPRPSTHNPPNSPPKRPDFYASPLQIQRAADRLLDVLAREVGAPLSSEERNS